MDSERLLRPETSTWNRVIATDDQIVLGHLLPGSLAAADWLNSVHTDHVLKRALGSGDERLPPSFSALIRGIRSRLANARTRRASVVPTRFREPASRLVAERSTD